jgi:hypothetical protein
LVWLGFGQACDGEALGCSVAVAAAPLTPTVPIIQGRVAAAAMAMTA